MDAKIFEIKQKFKKMKLDEFYRWLKEKYPDQKERDRLLAWVCLTGTDV